jgi:uncharacterized membrane protein
MPIQTKSDQTPEAAAEHDDDDAPPPRHDGDAPAPDDDGEAAARAQPPRTGRVAVAVGCASLGLGLAKLLAPGPLARLLGVGEDPTTTRVLRGLGVRDLVVGVGLLTSRRATPWLWARVAGDAMDLGLLGASLGAASDVKPGDMGRLTGALVAAGAVAAADVLAAVAHARQDDDGAGGATSVRGAVTIARPREDVYRFWRDFENAPAFMAGVESVEALDERRSRWSARVPAGPVVSWETVLVEDRPNELIRWCSADGADSGVRVDAAVRFETAAGGRGTEVQLELAHGAPETSGRAAQIAWQAAEADRIDADLRRCKQLLETAHAAR